MPTTTTEEKRKKQREAARKRQAKSPKASKGQRKDNRGAPSIWNEGLENDIVDLLHLGASLTDAAKFCGISRRTILIHREQDERFGAKIEKATIECKKFHLQRIKIAAEDPDNWRASAWFLSRKFPREWAEKRPDQYSKDDVCQIIKHIGDMLIERVTDPEAQREVAGLLDKVILKYMTDTRVKIGDEGYGEAQNGKNGAKKSSPGKNRVKAKTR